jgi:hypothetical protein
LIDDAEMNLEDNDDENCVQPMTIVPAKVPNKVPKIARLGCALMQ